MAPKPKRDHSAIALRYAQDVVGGSIPACGWVKKAAQRHLDDLANDSVLWPYTFDTKKANRACKIIELFPLVKGSKFLGKNLVLEPWQCFCVALLFGWVKKDTGKRRFRKAYIEVPKGNGKSALMSGIALVMLACDGEPGAEVYSAAITKEQAKIVFETARQMALKCPRFLEKFGVEVAAHDIHLVNDTLSVFRALASEADSLEGKNPHLCVIDELHAHPTRKLYENLESAMGKRDNNLLLSITTAGSDRLGICYETRGHVIETLDKLFVDESLFGIIYTLDDTDDWTLEQNWIKANPNWGVSVEPETIINDGRRAIFTTHKQPSFQTKHLDIWVNADNALVSARDWKACETAGMDIEDFCADPCVIGLDLASELDLTARMNVFMRRNDDGKMHYYVFGKYWLPAETIEKSSNPKYEGWAREQYIIRSEGATNDFDEIEADIKEAASQLDVQNIAYDPWQMKQMADHLTANGAPMVKVRPIIENFSPALKKLLALIADKRIHHDGDPVLAWAMSNVVGHIDVKDNIFPRKERYENKIDPVVALLMALCLVGDDKPKPKFWVVTSKEPSKPIHEMMRQELLNKYAD